MDKPGGGDRSSARAWFAALIVTLALLGCTGPPKGAGDVTIKPGHVETVHLNAGLKTLYWQGGSHHAMPRLDEVAVTVTSKATAAALPVTAPSFGEIYYVGDGLSRSALATIDVPSEGDFLISVGRAPTDESDGGLLVPVGSR